MLGYIGNAPGDFCARGGEAGRDAVSVKAVQPRTLKQDNLWGVGSEGTRRPI